MTERISWYVVAGIVFTSVSIYLLAPVLSPFLTAALLAYLGDPLVDRLETYNMPRTLAVAVVFVVIFSVVATLPFILVPLIEQQLSALLHKLPGYFQWIEQNILPSITDSFNIDKDSLTIASFRDAIINNWRDVGGVAGKIVNTVSQSGLAMAAWIANLILVPVVTFYLLRDWDVLMGNIRMLLPRSSEPTIVQLAKESDEVLGAFLRGQLIVMIALGIIYSIGLWIVGLDLAFLIGMIAGLVSFVPYLGSIVGIVLAGVATIMQFHDAFQLIFVALVFGVGQTIEGMVLTPLLVGDKIGLHPVAVIFAIMAGGQLYGFVGILIALPVAAVVMVLLRHMVNKYTQSALYGQNDSEQNRDNSNPPAADKS